MPPKRPAKRRCRRNPRVRIRALRWRSSKPRGVRRVPAPLKLRAASAVRTLLRPASGSSGRISEPAASERHRQHVPPSAAAGRLKRCQFTVALTSEDIGLSAPWEFTAVTEK